MTGQRRRGSDALRKERSYAGRSNSGSHLLELTQSHSSSKTRASRTIYSLPPCPCLHCDVAVGGSGELEESMPATSTSAGNSPQLRASMPGYLPSQDDRDDLLFRPDSPVLSASMAAQAGSLPPLDAIDASFLVRDSTV